VCLHQIELQGPEFERFCRKWQVRELAVFGSVLGADFGPQSDVDLLVTFADRAPWDLLDFLRMQDEASALLGRRVDLVTRDGLEESANPLVKSEVIRTARTVYAAT